MANTIRLVASYENTNFTRQYDLDIEDEFVSTAKQKILDINASLTAGTSGGFNSFFVGENGENLESFTKAQLITVTETVLDLEGSE